MSESTAAQYAARADYLPRAPQADRHTIGLIGCGFISEAHLAAYREASFRVGILCDRTLAKAQARRDAFAPDAEVTTDVDAVLSHPQVDVVDIATHVPGRPALIERALAAKKHVLSQKPFVGSIADGQQLVRRAHECGRLLAVNHNGRWAPHFAAALALVDIGAIGTVTSADFTAYWPHDQNFADDPHFSTMEDLILYDFGIHWFDIVAQLLVGAGAARSVYASAGRRIDARIPVPTEADVIVEYDTARATLCFRGSAPYAESGGYRIEGTEGVIVHVGHSLGGASVELHRSDGSASIDLEGDWWSNGMRGTMAELLHAIDEHQVPRNAAESSLPGLRLCFAALESVRARRPVDPATVDTRRPA